MLGPNINVPMEASANAPALAALEQAQALAAHASDKEQALIAALAKRYSADPKVDRAALDKAWADALGEVAQRFPEDTEIAVLHAEAMMDTQPWDYWTDGGRQAKGRANEIVAELERAMAKNPDHPGAIHLYIHAVEASDRPERAEARSRPARRADARRRSRRAHAEPHLLPRGPVSGCTRGQQGGGCDRRGYIDTHKPSGPYPLAYYPHNLHFLVAAAHAAGDGKTARMRQRSSRRWSRPRSRVPFRWCSPTWRRRTGRPPCSARRRRCSP